MKWERAKPWRPSELKYEEGKELSNGYIVAKPLDSLAKRAGKAERDWLRQNKMGSIKDNPPRQRKKKKKPRKTFYDQRQKFDDVVLGTIDRMKKD